MEKQKNGLGRRKEAVTRIFLSKGTGKITVNDKDYKEYFFSLLLNPIIIANDATTHPATSCFTESYLKPLGIKSMLDVPIMYKGEVIGVICIESLSSREWKETSRSSRTITTMTR